MICSTPQFCPAKKAGLYLLFSKDVEHKSATQQPMPQV